MLAISKYSNLKWYFLASLLMLLLIFGGGFLSVKFLTAQVISSSQGPDQTVINDLNTQIENQRAKIDQLAEKIEQYQTNIQKARNQATSLQNQIYILDNQIAKTNLDIEAQEEAIKITELEIEKIELEIKANQAVIDEHKNQLAAFIRLLDRYDSKNYLAVLLSHDSFSEFFDQVKYTEGIQADLQKTLNRVQELVARLNQQKDDLNDKHDKLNDLMNRLEGEKLVLASQKRTKQYLIAETRYSERQFQNLMEQLRQEQIAVNNQIAALERQLREELAKKGESEKFNILGEVAMIWPVNSRRITAYFRDTSYPFRHLFEHSGVDFGVPEGTPVMAAESGYVARVAIGTKWYGNYVMIIHNNNLATLYAHLSKVNVTADQYVSRGEVIALSGNTGFSTGPHLHFEVRLNGIPVNPLNYLP